MHARSSSTSAATAATATAGGAAIGDIKTNTIQRTKQQPSSGVANNKSSKLPFGATFHRRPTINRSHTFHSNQLIAAAGGGHLSVMADGLTLDTTTTTTTSNKSSSAVADDDAEVVEFSTTTSENVNGTLLSRESTSGHHDRNHGGSRQQVLANYVIKNGKRLFTWNRKQNHHHGGGANSSSIGQFLNSSSSLSSAAASRIYDQSSCLLSFSNGGVGSGGCGSASMGKGGAVLGDEQQLTNLIAAKLLSENIELTQLPYTDEMGFCKIPMALVKRYSCELKADIELVCRCFESERLQQLDKIGRIGIPNDFLFKPCQCNQSDIGSSSSSFACKCDLDTSSVVGFLTRLGLPMYSEVFASAASSSMQRLVELDDRLVQDVLEREVHSVSHRRTISDALTWARAFL